jgi:integrase
MEGWLFQSAVATQVDPSNLRKLFNSLLTDAKLRRVRFHDLRHTFASLLLQNGEALSTSKIRWAIAALMSRWISTGTWYRVETDRQWTSSMTAYQRWPRNGLERRPETNSGNNCKKIRLLARKLLICWRARRDSNPQPSDPKSDALSS